MELGVQDTWQEGHREEELLCAASNKASSNLKAIVAAVDAAIDDEAHEPDTTKAVLGPAAEDTDDGGKEAGHPESDNDDADSQDGEEGDMNDPPARDDVREPSTALAKDDDVDRDSGRVSLEVESGR